MSLVLLAAFLDQPMQAYASGSLTVNGGHHRRYTEVVVGSGRYYYNQGIFYTGAPGSYVVVEAPEGAVVYSVPYGYERVNIDGVLYYRYRDIYYRPAGRGYQVVRVDRSREHWNNGRRGGERRDERRDEHRGR